MQALNKRHMMFAISVSLMAYAFALAGCGQKKPVDATTKSADLAAVASIQGTWRTDAQTVKAGQQNLVIVKVTKKSMDIRTVCLIDSNDKGTTSIAVAEDTNKFHASSAKKSLKFEVPRIQKSTDNSDCAVTFPQGELQFVVDGDNLTLGMKADGSLIDAKENIKNVGMAFKKVTDDQAQAYEKTLRGKVPKIAEVLKDPNAPDSGVSDPVKQAAINKANAANSKLLAGFWLLKEDDQKVKGDKDLSAKLTKVNYDLIAFFDSTPRLEEAFACRYIDNKTQTRASVFKKLNPIGDNDASTNLFAAMAKDASTSGILYQSSTTKNAIMIQNFKQHPIMSVPSDLVSLSKDEIELSNCELSYKDDLEINFSFSDDGKTLTLTDSKNGTRNFNKIQDISHLSDSEKEAMSVLRIKPNDKDDKGTSAQDATKTADTNSPANTDTAGSASNPPVVPTTVTNPPAAPTTTTTNPPVVPATTTNPPVVPTTTTTNPPVVPATTTTNPAVVPVTTTTNPPVVPVTTTTNPPVVPATTTTNPAVVPTTTTTNPAKDAAAQTPGDANTAVPGFNSKNSGTSGADQSKTPSNTAAATDRNSNVGDPDATASPQDPNAALAYAAIHGALQAEDALAKAKK